MNRTCIVKTCSELLLNFIVLSPTNCNAKSIFEDLKWHLTKNTDLQWHKLVLSTCRTGTVYFVYGYHDVGK